MKDEIEWMEPLDPAQRARWLAELALAVDQAQRLAVELGGCEAKRGGAEELHAQLDAIRIEVEMLRRARGDDSHREIDPNWMKLFVNPRAA